MTITYKLENNLKNNLISITKKVDGNQVMSIPLDPDNIDYQEYLEWAKTNTADPADGKTWNDIRADRDRRLTETDWTQTPDVPQETIWKWKTYRQDLRDIPQKQTDPTNITWPTKPS
tara:strand:+ start:118 stop:468 length:351 start_codon:yes stop_codon:yes gene_type:complete